MKPVSLQTMGSWQVVVFSFVLACVWLSEARFLSGRPPAYLGDESQKPAEVEVGLAAGPRRGRSRERIQIQPGPELLSWRFPEPPAEPVKKSPARFEPRRPGSTIRAAVRCGESRIQVEVSQELLGRGTLIQPEEITLGGCSPTEVDTSAQVVVFESELHGCGSTLVMMNDVFVYAFTLVYQPKVSGRGHIVRSLGAAIGLECHYPRTQTVSSSRPLNPALAPDGGRPYFSLQLMTDDWTSERRSYRYTLSDVINMQASVVGGRHPPYRVLVDDCVAVASADSSGRRRDFIKNHGCLGDPGGPRSRFLAQSRPDELRIQVDPASLRLLKTMFITCWLKAVPASSSVTVENKLCSFGQSGWRAADGRDQICTCCASTCGMRKARDPNAEERWTAEVTLGPVVVDDGFMFLVKQ